MQLNKKLGTILYSLYGPNGSNQMFHESEKQTFAIYSELARQGLVNLYPMGFGKIEVKRVIKGN